MGSRAYLLDGLKHEFPLFTETSPVEDAESAVEASPAEILSDKAPATAETVPAEETPVVKEAPAEVVPAEQASELVSLIYFLDALWLLIL